MRLARIIALIMLLLTSVFGDTVKFYEKKLFDVKRSEKQLENVKYVGVSEWGLKILTSSTVLGDNYKYIPCEDMIELIDDSGEIIDYDCNEIFPDSELGPNKLKTEIQPSVKNSPLKPSFGGFLIAIGGFLIYQTYDMECSNCDTEEWVEFSDGITDQQQLGFILIGIGGLLVGIGL